MKPCNITSKSLIIGLLSDGKKTTAQIKVCEYLVSACIINSKLLLTFWYMNNKKSKEKNTFILQFTYIPSLDLFEYICMEVISYLC